MWIVVLIAAIVITGIIGAATADKGEEGLGCIQGGMTGGIGCGYILFNILLFVGGILLLLKLFDWLF